MNGSYTMMHDETDGAPHAHITALSGLNTTVLNIAFCQGESDVPRYGGVSIHIPDEMLADLVAVINNAYMAHTMDEWDEALVSDRPAGYED